MDKIKDVWKCNIPDGEIGEARIESFNVDDHGARMSSIRGSWIVPGEYKRLYVGGQLMMSDTPSEKRDHRWFIDKERGDVLINGLGLGCCVREALSKDCVNSVTVIEKSRDVIELVGRYFPEVEIIHSCAFDYKPSFVYETVWHDIWPDICTDNLTEMHRLHRKYGRKSVWQGSWSRERLEYMRKRERSYC